MHGAAVHFPMALVLCSGVLDVAGRLLTSSASRRGLSAAGYWTMLLGAAGSVPAVASGLVLSKGMLLGHDALRMHHLFVWPSFGLIMGLATWRALGKDEAHEATIGYLAVVGLAAVFVLAAGYLGRRNDPGTLEGRGPRNGTYGAPAN